MRYDQNHQLIFRSSPEKTSYFLLGSNGELLAEYFFNESNDIEPHRYELSSGSYRTGVSEELVELTSSHSKKVTRTVGNRLVELKDHTQSVRSVVADITTAQVSGDGIPIGTMWNSYHAADYFPYGMVFESRTLDSNYHYGYSSYSIPDGLTENSHTLDMGDRWLLTRIGRTSKPDTRADLFPSLSPYSYAANNPTIFIDPGGEEIVIAMGIERDGDEISPENSVVYREGMLFMSDGVTPYMETTNSYVMNVARDLDLIGADEQGAVVLRQLENSTKTHKIRMATDVHEGRHTKNNIEYYEQKVADGKQSNTWINYNPTEWRSVEDNERDPVIGLAHELMHAYDIDMKDWQDYQVGGVDVYEINAVNFENRFRFSLGENLRFSYAGNSINQGYLTNPINSDTPWLGAYPVSKGETLSGIANTLSVTLDDILRVNPQITDPNHIEVDQQILIPEGE